MCNCDIICFRYLYYFLKSENAHTKELLNVLEGLLHVDPTSELSEEYTQLATHRTGEWILLNITLSLTYFTNSLNENRFIHSKIPDQTLVIFPNFSYVKLDFQLSYKQMFLFFMANKND